MQQQWCKTNKNKKRPTQKTKMLSVSILIIALLTTAGFQISQFLNNIKNLNQKTTNMDSDRQQLAAVEQEIKDLIKALDTFNVPQKEKDELIGALATMKGDIVEVP